jgi:hypothetical protein
MVRELIRREFRQAARAEMEHDIVGTVDVIRA